MSFTPTEWILIAGFFVVAYALALIHSTLKEILRELSFIKTNTAPPFKMPVF
jgi:hypothetical protein